MQHCHPGQLVDRVVTADVLGQEKDLAAVRQRRSVHSARPRVQAPRCVELVHQVVQLLGSCVDVRLNWRHGFRWIMKGRPAPATRGQDPALREPDRMVKPYVHATPVPAYRQRLNLPHPLEQPFILQEAQRQGRLVDRRAHDRGNLPPVDVQIEQDLSDHFGLDARPALPVLHPVRLSRPAVHVTLPFLL